MATINIDGTDYDSEELSDEAKAQLQSLQFVDREMQLLNMKLAVLQTARNGYGRALKEILVNGEATAAGDIHIGDGGDTISFD